MKKLIISVLLIAIPTISNAARDDFVVPDLPVNPDLPITPELCPGVACEAGYELDYRSCECVRTEDEADCDLTTTDCAAQNTKWVSAGTLYPNKIRATHYILQEDTCECVRYYVAGCADGYYGIITESTSNASALNSVVCTQCPDGGTSSSLLGISAHPPAWAIASDYNGVVTSCYLPANTPVRGSHGKYICGSQMNYSFN